MTDLEYENSRILDVVNDKDEVLDSETRTQVHRLGLLHREVHIWMFDKNKNIFFQKRGLHSASAGSLDATIGGHVNTGEDYIDAAMRESREETGIKVNQKDLLLLKKFKGSHLTRDYLLGRINNFIRNVYIYKKPVEEKKLVKERGIAAGGFQKISYSLLLQSPEGYSEMFTHFILNEELPEVLKYLS